jgi:pyruvate kinase
MRRTKIVCTIGPATSSEERLEQLIRAGMNVARLNFSHGTQPEHALVIERIRTISARLGCAIAILQDLQGPKIRTGTLEGRSPVLLADGARVTITTRAVVGNAETIPITYKQLPQDVKEGDRILLDDGLLELRMLGSDETDVQCLVVHGGVLKEHKGVNLPGVAVSAPALTEKDRDDLKFGVRHGVDYIALSFVRRSEDIARARVYMQQLRAEASDVANAILDGTDALMLSAEMATGAYPLEAVQMMGSIAQETEADYRRARQPQCQHLTPAHAVSHAARALAEETSVQAIVVFTRSGASAHLISTDRPRTPILAYTPSEYVYRQLALWWGVWPYRIDLQKTTEELIAHVDQMLQEDKLISRGEHVVIMGGLPVASEAPTNFVKLQRVGDGT